MGLYTAEQWTGTHWIDTSGSGNDVTITSGSIIKAATGINGHAYIYGNVDSSLTWPVDILPSTYTLFHVARYNGPTRRSIFNGYSDDNIWVSGFYFGLSGFAIHDTWQSPSKDCCGSNWVLSTDQNDLYRANGFDKFDDRTQSEVMSSSNRLAVNIHEWGQYGDSSDWAIAAVVVFNRTLSDAEISSVERWLAQLYRLSIRTTDPTKPPSLPPTQPIPPQLQHLPPPTLNATMTITYPGALSMDKLSSLNLTSKPHIISVVSWM